MRRKRRRRKRRRRKGGVRRRKRWEVRYTLGRGGGPRTRWLAQAVGCI